MVSSQFPLSSKPPVLPLAVNNGGRIDKMTYIGGTYNNALGGRTGTINTLTLAGDSANNTGDWGIVENLKFDTSGNGLLTISAFIEEPSSPFGIQAASTSIAPMNAALPNILFSGINAGSVDLTYGNVALDLIGFDVFGDDLVSSFFSAFGFTNGFSLTDLLGDMFGTTDVRSAESLNSFEVAFGDMDSFWILNDGVFAEDWSFNNDTGYVSWNGTSGDLGDNTVPEPATLVILGLGLAGLGLARRRRK